MSRDEEIALIRRQIEETERRVASQRDVVDRLRELGADTRAAKDILGHFEATLAQLRLNLKKLTGDGGTNA